MKINHTIARWLVLWHSPRSICNSQTPLPRAPRPSTTKATRDGGTNANGTLYDDLQTLRRLGGGNQIGSTIPPAPRSPTDLFSVNLDFGPGAFNGARANTCTRRREPVRRQVFRPCLAIERARAEIKIPEKRSVGERGLVVLMVLPI